MDDDIKALKDKTFAKSHEMAKESMPAMLRRAIYFFLSAALLLLVDQIGTLTFSLLGLLVFLVVLELLQILIFFVVLQYKQGRLASSVSEEWGLALDLGYEVHNKNWTLIMNEKYKGYSTEIVELREKIENYEIEHTELALDMNRLVRLIMEQQNINLNQIKKIRPEVLP